jgi:hypothetical protein
MTTREPSSGTLTVTPPSPPVQPRPEVAATLDKVGTNCGPALRALAAVTPPCFFGDPAQDAACVDGGKAASAGLPRDCNRYDYSTAPLLWHAWDEGWCGWHADTGGES